jgi:hypothetical protein
MGTPEQPSWTNKKGWERGDDAEAEVKRSQSKQPEPAKPRNNPWAKGGELEKTLTPQDLEAIVDRRKLENVGNEDIEFEFFLEALIDAGGTYSETYDTDGEGKIFQPESSALPDLLSCSPASIHKIEGGLAISYTAEDLRSGAAEIIKRYPDIGFEFNEDRTKRTITYKAKLKI